MGLGRWGDNYVREVTNAPGVRLAAVASRRSPSAKTLPPSIRWYGDWRGLMDAGGLDGIIIATPPATHGEIASAAISRSIPVLIEKPLTLDAAEAYALLDIASASQALAHVNHIDLFNPAWRVLRRRLESIGPVVRMEGAWYDHGPFRSDTRGRWDWGAHAIAVALDVDHSDARLVGARFLPAKTGELVEAILEWDSGATAKLVFGNGASVKARRMSIIGARGRLDFDAVEGARAVHDEQAIRFCAQQSPLRATVLRFAASIRCGREVAQADLALGARVVAFLEEIDHALAAG